VRLLVPGGTDIPILRPISRAGYRPLLDAGVRVFEWNGSMLHAKTAVADSRWARVGSTNLNIASWFGNCELDLMVENETFAHEMEEMYLQDLTNSTEVILDERNGVRAAGSPGRRQPVASSGGSTSRAAAGALRIGSAVGAAVTNQRVFEPVENRILASFGGLLLGLAVLFKVFPAALVYPAVLLFGWLGLALVYKACRLRLKRGSRVAKIKSHSSTTDGHPTSKSSGP
jgi:cardiolipin synthase A/B